MIVSGFSRLLPVPPPVSGTGEGDGRERTRDSEGARARGVDTAVAGASCGHPRCAATRGDCDADCERLRTSGTIALRGRRATDPTAAVGSVE